MDGVIRGIRVVRDVISSRTEEIVDRFNASSDFSAVQFVHERYTSRGKGFLGGIKYCLMHCEYLLFMPSDHWL